MVLVLIEVGFHVPVMAGVFVELKGKAGALVPSQIGAIVANVGKILLVTSMFILVFEAH